MAILFTEAAGRHNRQFRSDPFPPKTHVLPDRNSGRNDGFFLLGGDLLGRKLASACHSRLAAGNFSNAYCQQDMAFARGAELQIVASQGEKIDRKFTLQTT